MLQMSKGRNPSLAFDERFLKLISTLYLTRYFYSISCLNGRVGYSVCFKFCIDDCSYTLKKQRSKISQLEKVRFIKVNQLNLTHVELFSFFHFRCVDADATKLFCMTYLPNIKRFLCHSNLPF